MLIFLNKKKSASVSPHLYTPEGVGPIRAHPPPRVYKDGGILMQIFFIKKKSTSYHDADDPGNGEGMGGDWKRDTFQTPLISPEYSSEEGAK